eukprot:353551-Chlamydomonas_euryale.AAC.1
MCGTRPHTDALNAPSVWNPSPHCCSDRPACVPQAGIWGVGTATNWTARNILRPAVRPLQVSARGACIETPGGCEVALPLWCGRPPPCPPSQGCGAPPHLPCPPGVRCLSTPASGASSALLYQDAAHVDACRRLVMHATADAPPIPKSCEAYDTSRAANLYELQSPQQLPRSAANPYGLQSPQQLPRSAANLYELQSPQQLPRSAANPYELQSPQQLPRSAANPYGLQSPQQLP